MCINCNAPWSSQINSLDYVVRFWPVYEGHLITVFEPLACTVPIMIRTSNISIIIFQKEQKFTYKVTISFSLIAEVRLFTVRKYYRDIDRDGHEISRFGGLPRELYFPKGLYFPEVRSTEGKYCPEGKIDILAPPTRDISSVPVNICYIRWSKWIILSKIRYSMTTTKFGNKTRSLRTKQTERKLHHFARFLLWRSIVNHCVLGLRGACFLG